MRVYAARKNNVTNASIVAPALEVMIGVDFDSSTATPRGSAGQWFNANQGTFQNSTMMGDDALTSIGAHFAQEVNLSSGTGVTTYFCCGQKYSIQLNEIGF